MPEPRIAFVLPNPRAELAAAVARGEAPDSTLLGWNHVAPLGLDGQLHDPWLTRHVKGDTPLHRVAWNLREVLLPFELTHADAVFTPLSALFPLVARVRRLPVVVVNYGLCLIYERAGRERRALLRANLRAAHCVVCLGESQRQQIIEQAGLDPARVHTVRLGIDAGWFAPRGGAGDGTVLAVGKDLARDYGTLIDAVQPLGVRTHIAGYRRNVTGLDLPAAVTAGDMPIGELREAIARVLGDPQLAARLGAAARAGVEEGLTSAHFAAGIAPLLHAAAGR